MAEGDDPLVAKLRTLGDNQIERVAKIIKGEVMFENSTEDIRYTMKRTGGQIRILFKTNVTFSGHFHLLLSVDSGMTRFCANTW